MKIAEYKQGQVIYREATEDDISLVVDPVETEQASDPLTAMASAMSTATTLAQMRAAAKAFLEATGGEGI